MATWPEEARVAAIAALDTRAYHDGLDITERVPLQLPPHPENIAYLRTKRERMGHILHGLDDVL